MTWAKKFSPSIITSKSLFASWMPKAASRQTKSSGAAIAPHAVQAVQVKKSTSLGIQYLHRIGHLNLSEIDPNTV